MSSRRGPEFFILLFGLGLLVGAGVIGYSVDDAANTHQYTMSEATETEAIEYANTSYNNTFQYKDLPESDQAVIENTLEQNGSYTTKQAPVELRSSSDTGERNLIEYENEYYFLEVRTEMDGLGALSSLILLVPFIILGGVFVLIALLLYIPQWMRSDPSEQ